jgi:drug/metabolite transporter (DMT)-like permease
MAQRPSSWLAVLLVVAAASLFGTLGPLSRTAYDAGLAPFAWVAWRAGFGAAALWLVIAGRRGPRSIVAGLRAAPASERRWLALAILASALLNLSVFVAFQRTTIALALLAFYTYPAIVAAVSAVLGHERLDGSRRAALALAIVGMAAVVVGGLQPDAGLSVDALGLGLALFAAACQSTFVVASRGYASIRTEEAMGSILIGCCAIAAVATIVVDGPGALALPIATPGLLGLLVGVGLLAAALPSFLFLTGIRRLGPVRAGILMLWEPVVGIVLAGIVLGQVVTTIQLVGGATILAAAVLAQRPGHRAGGAAEELPVPLAPAPGGP